MDTKPDVKIDLNYRASNQNILQNILLDKNAEA